MTEDDAAEIRMTRDFRCAPATLWRALTQPQLIAEWLMQNDFAPVEGRGFTLTADWGQVNCVLREIEPERRLSYSWDSKDLRSVVTWVLEPIEGGTRLHLTQTGFQPGQRPYLQGARAGWPRFLDALDATLRGIPEAGRAL